MCVRTYHTVINMNLNKENTLLKQTKMLSAQQKVYDIVSLEHFFSEPLQKG